MRSNNFRSLSGPTRRRLAFETLEDRALLSGDTQVVTPSVISPMVAPGSAVSFDVHYSTSTGDNTLPGLGLRLHYNSSLVSYAGMTNVLLTSLFTQQPFTPADDTANYDGDATTDKYVMVSWADIGGNWPGTALPVRLYTATFTALHASAAGTALRFSASPAAAYTLASTPVSISFPQVVARSIFYNRSAFDGNDPAAGPADDSAIAADKTALLPGQQATWQNYTSYSRGINGLMIDLDVVGDDVTAANFQFRAGNGDNPAAWTALAISPTISIRHNVGGRDRVTLTWPDNTIQDTWLEVKVLSSMAVPDVFYFGNMRGETGDSTADSVVNVADFAATRSRSHSPAPAGITDPYDHDRDGLVSAADYNLVRASLAPAGQALRRIRPVAGDKADPPSARVEPAERPLAGRDSQLLTALARAAADRLFLGDDDWFEPEDPAQALLEP